MIHLHTEFQFKILNHNGDNERKLKIIEIFVSPRGIILPKIIRPDPNSKLNLRILVLHIYTEFQFKMSICNEEYERKLKIIGFFSKSKGHNSAERKIEVPRDVRNSNGP